MTSNFWRHSAISALKISKNHFATFDFFVKMKLVSTVWASTSLSKSGYSEVGVTLSLIGKGSKYWRKNWWGPGSKRSGVPSCSFIAVLESNVNTPFAWWLKQKDVLLIAVQIKL